MTGDKKKEVLEVLKEIVRIGTVHAYDPAKRMARVKFDNLGGIISPPIKVLSRPRVIVPADGTMEGSKVAGTTLKYDKHDSLSTESHTHAAYVTDWNPKVNTMVLCLYYPDGGGDGYVLGEV